MSDRAPSHYDDHNVRNVVLVRYRVRGTVRYSRSFYRKLPCPVHTYRYGTACGVCVLPYCLWYYVGPVLGRDIRYVLGLNIITGVCEDDVLDRYSTVG